MNEVVDDVRAFERPPDRRCVGDVGDNPGDALLRRLSAPGDSHDLLFGREGREERAADEASRAEDDDSHGGSPPMSLRKYLRLRARWNRRWTST